jgi:uncharacterized protein YybS (DUF2232 family)
MVIMNLLGKGFARAAITGSILTFILFLLQRTLPVIGVLAGIAIPFPCVYLTMQSGRKAGYAIVGFLIIGLYFLGSQELLIYLLQSVAISLALPEFLLRGNGISKSLLYTVGINTLLLVAFVFAYGELLHGDFDGQMRGAIHSAVAQVEGVYRSMGLAASDEQELVTALRAMEKHVGTIYPALVVIFCWLSAACNLLLLRKSLPIQGKDAAICCGSFSRFRNPDCMVWLLIAGGFTLLVDQGYVTRITLNVLLVILFLYFVQGLAVVTYFQRKLSLSRFLLPVFYFLMLLQPIVMVPVAAIGLFDLWADFRTPKQQENL